MYNVARQLDLSTYGNRIDTDGVKLYCAPMAKKIADRAIQVDSRHVTCSDFNNCIDCRFLEEMDTPENTKLSVFGGMRN